MNEFYTTEVFAGFYLAIHLNFSQDTPRSTFIATIFSGVKKEIFWTKLIFKTKEQERDNMISVEGMSDNFKRTYQSAQCIIDST